jgi:MFS family permease
MSDAPSPETRERPLIRGAWLALTALLLAQAMGNMDSSIVNVATKTIFEDLGASGGELQTILAGYTLMFGILVVTGARLGDDKGFRRMFLTGLIGFVTASLLCGLAPTGFMLALSRSLQGACGALMVPQIMSSIQTIFSGKSLARAISYYSLILAVGVAAGQILGGLVVGADLFGASWRVAFLLNVPVGIAIFMMALNFLPPNDPKPGVKLDLAGVGILGVAMALLVLPLMFGRSQGWPLWTWLSFAAGAIVMTIFVRFEQNLLAKDGRPLLDLRALAPRGVKPGILALCLLNFVFAGISFPLTLHLQTALEYSPVEAGLMFVPYPIGFATISLTWTKWPERWHPRLPMIGLALFSITVAGLVWVVSLGWPVPLAALVLLLCGATMATSMSPLINQIASAVNPKFASSISALMSTGTLLFAVFSVSTVGSLYLAFAENDVTRSVTGIMWAFGLDTILLVVATACAVRMWWAVTHPGAAPVPSAEPADKETGEPASVEAAPDSVKAAEAELAAEK